MIPLIYRFPYIGVSPIHHGFQYKKWSHDLDNLGARSWIRKPPFLHGESKSVDFRIGILFWWLPSLFMIKHHLAFFENASKPIGSSSFVPSFSIMFHPYPYYKYNFCCFPPFRHDMPPLGSTDGVGDSFASAKLPSLAIATTGHFIVVSWWFAQFISTKSPRS